MAAIVVGATETSISTSRQLGIPHQCASIIWICGPVLDLFMQPLIGHINDRCTSRFDRRRPFILIDVVIIFVVVLIIAYTANISWLLSDTTDYHPVTITIFIIDF
ncbi:hypothetical protein AAZX31_03G135800 [Glycine max]|uniref:Uncharacterized protein n=1 Tax=Glycine max TaxID=3847 RepID=K7KF88_SOYBN|nr:sucrose transport protein SUC4-like isoform X2 [Glycine soja]XP_040870009.1 sucrose transport protein SUC4 isoform X2 [Glycine max]KAH1070168.1 hypothetical protein GYH30_007327 [Glycine max]KRH67203.1 hypothetical protein GLYMA_03G153700v4 [Glycine max]